MRRPKTGWGNTGCREMPFFGNFSKKLPFFSAIDLYAGAVLFIIKVIAPGRFQWDGRMRQKRKWIIRYRRFYLWIF